MTIPTQSVLSKPIHTPILCSFAKRPSLSQEWLNDAKDEVFPPYKVRNAPSAERLNQPQATDGTNSIPSKIGSIKNAQPPCSIEKATFLNFTWLCRICPYFPR